MRPLHGNRILKTLFWTLSIWSDKQAGKLEWKAWHAYSRTEQMQSVITQSVPWIKRNGQPDPIHLKPSWPPERVNSGSRRSESYRKIADCEHPNYLIGEYFKKAADLKFFGDAFYSSFRILAGVYNRGLWFNIYLARFLKTFLPPNRSFLSSSLSFSQKPQAGQYKTIAFFFLFILSSPSLFLLLLSFPSLEWFSSLLGAENPAFWQFGLLSVRFSFSFFFFSKKPRYIKLLLFPNFRLLN